MKDKFVFDNKKIIGEVISEYMKDKVVVNEKVVAAKLKKLISERIGKEYGLPAEVFKDKFVVKIDAYNKVVSVTDSGEET